MAGVGWCSDLLVCLDAPGEKVIQSTGPIIGIRFVSVAIRFSSLDFNLGSIKGAKPLAFLSIVLSCQILVKLETERGDVSGDRP